VFDSKHPELNRKCVVNLISGNAVEGVCTKVRPTYLIRAAILHQLGEHDPVPLDGEVSIDRINIDFVQLL
jgi:hypothetical protein